MINDLLRRWLHKEYFSPGVLGIFVNPFYFSRKELHRELSELAACVTGRILDVGCGTKPYRELFAGVDQYDGLEVDTQENRINKKADFFYDGMHFPCNDRSYEGVVCNEVLEHVFNPDEFLKEIARVLVPGGKLLLSVPFVWDEHEQPWDYARYSSFGLKYLLERNGFQVLEARKTNADARVLFQLINAYLYKVLRTRSAWLNVAICIVFLAPVNVFGILLGAILPANRDLYLDQVVLATKKTNQ